MPQFILPGSPSVTVHLRRSTRARRLSLRVSQLDGKVTLTLPNSVAEVEAYDFALAKSDWIREHLQRRPAEELVKIGAQIPVEGHMHRVTEGAGRRAQLQDGQILVSVQSTGRRVQAYLIDLARARLATAADEYAGRVGRPYTSLTLRDTRSRWGSCSEAGRLMFSWRLIMAPPEVLQYVAAHEAAHLKEMHHGPEFWDEVTRIFGPHDQHRRWLHENAGQLHRYRF